MQSRHSLRLCFRALCARGGFVHGQSSQTRKQVLRPRLCQWKGEGYRHQDQEHQDRGKALAEGRIRECHRPACHGDQNVAGPSCWRISLRISARTIGDKSVKNDLSRLRMIFGPLTPALEFAAKKDNLTGEVQGKPQDRKIAEPPRVVAEYAEQITPPLINRYLDQRAAMRRSKNAERRP